jgi:hypothetical protein
VLPYRKLNFEFSFNLTNTLILGVREITQDLRRSQKSWHFLTPKEVTIQSIY